MVRNVEGFALLEIFPIAVAAIRADWKGDVMSNNVLAVTSDTECATADLVIGTAGNIPRSISQVAS